MRSISVVLLIAILLISCGEETLPKPKPYLKLNYPESRYLKLNSGCPFDFEFSNQAIIDVKNNCWMTMRYPKLKATVHLTYRKVDNNLNEILKEVERLTYEHTVKADAIPNALPYENFSKKVFGRLYKVEGNVASNIQFRATDSVKHVLAGSLYFYAKPNYDSIAPAIKYLEKDIMHLIETLEWK